MKKLKRVFGIVLALAMLLTLTGPAMAAYADTEGHWAEAKIDKWTPIVGIYNGSKIYPNEEITRGEVFAILNSVYNYSPKGENPFSDLSKSHKYYDDIVGLYEAGIVYGTGDKVEADTPITREQAFAIFARIMKATPDLSALDKFADKDKVSSWARSSMSAMVKAGYVVGGDTGLNPLGLISRAEAIQLMDATHKDAKPNPNAPAAGGSTPGGTTPGGTTPGGTTPGGTTPGGDAKEFNTAKSAVLEAIEEAALPSAAELEGKTICIESQEVISYPAADDKQVNPTIVRDENMLPFTNWPEVGVPAITSDYGSTAATGIYAEIEAMLALAPSGYDMEADGDFADFNAFAAKYLPAAIEGTPVTTMQAYVVAVSGDGAPVSQENDPDDAFKAAYPETASEYRVYSKVIEVGEGETDLRLLNSFPLPASYVRGVITPEHLDAFVYDFGINKNGVAVSFNRVVTDVVQSYKALDGDKIQISWFDDEVFDIADGAKLYDVVLPGRSSTSVSITEVGPLADLEGVDWGYSIRAVFNEAGEIVEAYRSGTSSDVEPTSADYTTAQKFDYYEGIKADDELYGYDGVENPYPVDFALYNPITDEANTGASDPDAKYPLFIYLHGFSGGTDKNMQANLDGIGLNYISEEYQNEFKTGTDGVTGAYVMLPRSSRHASHDLNAQGWLYGYRGLKGDENYRGQAAQAAALIADVLWLIDNENIDPDRIYLTGQSAGGYMTWATLFEAARLGYADLFDAAIPNAAVLQPEGRNSEITGDTALTELGLKEMILSVKDIPIWVRHGRADTTCIWEYTIGETFSSDEYAINGKKTMWEIFGSFIDGESDIQGNPLTRVTIANTLGHSSPYVATNNKLSAEDLATVNADLGTDYSVAYYSQIFCEQPDDYVEYSSLPRGFKPSTAYECGASSVYSTGSYDGTIISWLNACGDAKVAANTPI